MDNNIHNGVSEKDDVAKILEIVRDIQKNQESAQSRNGLAVYQAHQREYENELKSLRSQLKGMEILLQQNAVLEQEVCNPKLAFNSHCSVCSVS